MSAKSINKEALDRLRAIADFIRSAGKTIDLEDDLQFLLDTIERAADLFCSEPAEATRYHIIAELQKALDFDTEELCAERYPLYTDYMQIQ